MHERAPRQGMSGGVAANGRVRQRRPRQREGQAGAGRPAPGAHGGDAEYRAIFEASSDGLVVNDLDTGLVVEANPAFCRMHGYDQMAGLHPSTFIHPSSQHLFEAFLRAVRAGQEFRCQAQDVRQDGTVFDVEVLGRTFTYRGKPATLGVVRDVTERVRAYEGLEQRVVERTREIEQRQEVAEALGELLTVVNSKRPLDQILDDVVRQAGRLLGSDAEALYLLDERDLTLLRLQASRNLPPGGPPPIVASGTPTMGLAAQRRRPVVAPDLPRLLTKPFAATVDEQVDDRGAYLELVRRGPASAGDSLRQRGQGVIAELFCSEVAVPLIARGTCYGSLLLAYRARHVPSDDELGLIAAFANQAGLAIENARLHEESEQRRHDLEALYDADHALHRSLRLQDVLEALVNAAVELLHADGGGLWGPDPAHPGRIGPLATHGLSSEYLDQTTLLNQDPSVYKLWWDHESFAVDDVAHDPRIPRAQRAALRREGYAALLSTRVRVGDEVFGSFTVGHRTRYTFSQAEQRLLTALAQRAGLAIQNARLHEESERRLAELAALYRADEQIYGSLRVQEVLDALVEVAAGILRPDKVAVGILDERTNRIVVGAARGFDAETVAAWVPAEDAAPLLTHLEGGVVVMEDVQADPRLPASIRLANEREGVRSSMTAPIKAGKEMIGAFGLSYCQPRTFGAEEQRLLQALAQRAALAIQNARLYEQAQQAATLEERQRLARELHDAVTQTLFSTALMAEVLPELWEVAPNEARQRLGELRRLTRGALAEMRTLLVELRPGALTDLPLGDLLRQLADATTGRTRLEVVVRVDGQARPLPPAVQVALYRIAQEALNNVVKHAQARQATVVLSYEASGSVHLQLADDGRGFVPSDIPPGHLGLGIMRERADGIGARLGLSSRSDGGTTIEVHWQDWEAAAP